MVNQIKLTLRQPEYSALLELATAELRSPADQAHHLVRRELQRRGLLPNENTPSVNSETAVSARKS